MKKSNETSRNPDSALRQAQEEHLAKAPDKKPVKAPDIRNMTLGEVLGRSDIFDLELYARRGISPGSIIDGSVKSWLKLASGAWRNDESILKRWPGVLEEGNYEYLFEKARERRRKKAAKAFRTLAVVSFNATKEGADCNMVVDAIAILAEVMGMKEEQRWAGAIGNAFRLAEDGAVQLAFYLNREDSAGQHHAAAKVKGFLNKIVRERPAEG